MRALRRLRLHTRAKRQRQKAKSEISVENDAARAAKSGAIAGQVRVLRPGVFCPGKGRGRSASGRMCRAGFGGRAGAEHSPRLPEAAQEKFTALLPMIVREAMKMKGVLPSLLL